jgi:EAL domain-containing protein (putative c-di-GMP-specific phosphodiesterase class I)
VEEFSIGMYLLLAGTAGGAAATIVMTIVWANYPKSIGGLGHWIGAGVVLGLSSVLFSGRLPLFGAATEFCARVAFIGGLMLIYAGLRRFARMRSTNMALLRNLVIVVAMLIGTSWLEEGNRIGIIIAMVCATALSVASVRAITFIRNKSFPEYFTGAVLATLVALYVLRIGIVAADLDTGILQAHWSFAQKLYFFGASTGLGVLLLGLLMVASKRLRETLIYAAVYHELDVSERERRWALGEDLQMAIEREQLAVHYQPRVDTQSGRIAAVEALLRWTHPAYGAIEPGRFIPIAEETGSIGQLGLWVLQQGAAFAALLETTHPGVRVSINVSAMQIAAPGFVELVRKTIAEAGAAPSTIELELTESVVIADPEHAQATLNELRSLGVHLAIDDFGTGYSSLSYLKRLPVSCVKIDRSFIHDIPDQQDALRLTQAIIGIGHALQLCIVAEGVETREQLDFLRAAGVQEYQGFLFARPLPEQEALQLLARARHAVDGAGGARFGQRAVPAA